MSHVLNYEAVQEFPNRREDVYHAIMRQKITTADPNVLNAVLSIEHVSGTVGQVGYEVVVRTNWGSADLEVSEVTLTAVPHSVFRVSQQPYRLVTFNPKERRLPATVCMMDDLEAGFKQAFGATPPETEIQFDLHPTGNGTNLQISMRLLTDRKPNWFARRRWTKNIPIETEQIFARIKTALTETT